VEAEAAAVVAEALRFLLLVAASKSLIRACVARANVTAVDEKSTAAA
jgi:hypothetical protein